MDYLTLSPVMTELQFVLTFLGALAVFLICLGVSLYFFVKSAFDDFNNRRKIAGIVFVVLAFLSLAAFSAIGIDQQSRKESNKVAAEANLKSKYDIKGIVWEGRDVSTDPISTRGDVELTVTDKNNRPIMFKYKVDMNTGEPFLISMPVNGGSESEITPESLEK